MGKRGPAPIPTAILKARGSWRGKRNPSEPIGISGAPDCPKNLGKNARDIWRRVLEIIPAGVLTRDNAETLGRYCHMLSRWWKLARWIDTHSETCRAVDQLGNVRITRHPNLITYEKLSSDLLRIEQQFGLTPSARSGIHAIAAPPPGQTAQRSTKEPFALRIAE